MPYNMPKVGFMEQVRIEARAKLAGEEYPEVLMQSADNVPPPAGDEIACQPAVWPVGRAMVDRIDNGVIRVLDLHCFRDAALTHARGNPHKRNGEGGFTMGWATSYGGEMRPKFYMSGVRYGIPSGEQLEVMMRVIDDLVFKPMGVTVVIGAEALV